jgi:molybdate transport system permease protein
MDISPLYLSLKLSLTTTILLILIAPPIVYSLVFIKIPGKTFLDALINLPIVLPPTVIGFCMLIMMGPHGIGNLWERITGSHLLFTFTGLVIASVIYNLPFAVAPMRTAFSRIDPRLIENAQVLGLSQYSVFFRVILPNSIPGIAASSILVFLHTIGEFGVILMISGSIPGSTKVASIAIYEAVENLRYRDAWMMSLVLILVSYIFLLAINYLNRGSRNYEP